ncbi:MAG TPA: hypothetical protein VJ984_14210 [Xanthomonadales bacterium]|nr:hypothetical protein [Xanthomonadales bacterium]
MLNKKTKSDRKGNLLDFFIALSLIFTLPQAALALRFEPDFIEGAEDTAVNFDLIVESQDWRDDVTADLEACEQQNPQQNISHSFRLSIFPGDLRGDEPFPNNFSFDGDVLLNDQPVFEGQDIESLSILYCASSGGQPPVEDTVDGRFALDFYLDNRVEGFESGSIFLTSPDGFTSELLFFEISDGTPSDPPAPIPNEPSPGQENLVAGSSDSGEGLPALLVPTLFNSSEMKVDGRGQLYFEDAFAIKRVEDDGSVKTIVESTVESDFLNNSMDFDIQGDFLYFIRGFTSEIYRVNLETNVTSLFATVDWPEEIGNEFFRYCLRCHLAVDSTGNVFISAAASVTGIWDGQGVLRIDRSSRNTALLAGFADRNNDRIYQGENGLGVYLEEIFDMSVNRQSGELYLADSNRIHEVSLQSGLVNTVLSEPPSSTFGSIESVDVLDNGEVLFTEACGSFGFSGCQVHVWRLSTNTGSISVAAGNGSFGIGGDGGSAFAAAIEAGEITSDTEGNIYIAGDGRIRFVEVERDVISTVVGQPGFLSCASPLESRLRSFGFGGIGVDDNGIIYAESNDAVLAIDSGIESLFVVGGIYGVPGNSDDGLEAFGSPISPSRLAVAPNGDIFFSDLGSNEIRKIDRGSGLLSTLANIDANYLHMGDNNYLYASRSSDSGGDLVDDIVRIDTLTGDVEEYVSGGASRPALGESAQGRAIFYPYGFVVDSQGSIYFGVVNGLYKIEAGSRTLSQLNQEYFVDERGFSNFFTPPVVAIDRPGNLLYFGPYDSEFDNPDSAQLIKLDLNTGELTQYLQSIGGFIRNLTVAPNGDLIATTVLSTEFGSLPSMWRISPENSLESQQGIPNDIGPGARAGQSSARLKDWLAIGVPNVPGSAGNSGEVLLYQDNDCRPILRNRLKPPAGQLANRFGSRVTFAEDTLVIGTSDEPGGLGSSFRLGAYSLDSQGRNWSLTDDLSSDLSDVTDASDSNLVSDGRYFAVSAPQANAGEGEVVVFDARNLGSPRILEAPGGFIKFGKSLALDGDRIAVGADSSESTAVVQDFVRQGNQFVLNATTDGPPNTPDFAAALALEDDTLFIGMPHPSGGGVFDYTITPGVLSFNNILTDPLDPLSPSFGAALATEDGKLVVGAPELSGVTTNVQSTKIPNSTTLNGADGSGGLHLFGFKNRLRERVAASHLFSRLANGLEGYGRSVDINNGRIVAGAPETDNNRGDFESVPDVVYSHELSGLWYDPELDGEGFNVLVADNTLVVYFYGYDSDGERLWLIGTVSGTFRFGEDIYVDMFKAIDGDFGNPVPSDESLVKWGLLSMTYGSLDSATFILNGFDGTKISRAVFLLDAESNAALYSGLWYDASRDGEGYNVISGLPGTIVYYYGSTDSGERLWLISDLLPENISDGTTLSGTMFEAQGGDFYRPVPSNEALESWGTINARFTDCDKGNFTLTGNDGSLSENVVKLAGVAGAECQ